MTYLRCMGTQFSKGLYLGAYWQHGSNMEVPWGKNTKLEIKNKLTWKWLVSALYQNNYHSFPVDSTDTEQRVLITAYTMSHTLTK